MLRKTSKDIILGVFSLSRDHKSPLAAIMKNTFFLRNKLNGISKMLPTIYRKILVEK